MKNLFAGLICLFFAGVLQAATVRNLYSVELLVPQQQPRPAQAQLSQGLKEVLIKVSGRSNVAVIPGLRAALSNPAVLLQQFSYQATQTPVSAGDGREVLGQRLKLDFDSVLVDQLLHDNNLQAIGHARPALMVWLVSQVANGERDYVAPEGRVYSQLATLASQRALPIDVPLLDLTDQQMLAVSDLWGFFRAPIEQASARYQPDAVLVGRLYQHNNGGWETRWLLLNGDKAVSFEPDGALSDQLEQVINQSADSVLGRLGSVSLSYIEEGMKLEISNIDGVDDYLKLLDYVRQLPPVENAVVHRIDTDRVTLRVKVQGGESALAQAVRLNPLMIATPRVAAAEDTGSILVYRWQE
ncbi:DUF2066 domain-containing protein [Amphritea sp. HPY]|uniref:DUF2066 domain-containing protein n=1 Tax=Amphritea sp. HPY TaxID=3421652 RepID=UPI003D7DDBE4